MGLGKLVFYRRIYMKKNTKKFINGSIIGGVSGAIIQLLVGGIRLTFKGTVISLTMPVLISIGIFIGIVYVLSGIITD